MATTKRVSGTHSNDTFKVTGDALYLGGKGNDTYIISNDLATGAIATIIDTEGANTVQLNDGLSVLSSRATGNAVEMTLSNNSVVRVLGAHKVLFQVGADKNTDDTAPYRTLEEVANWLGITLPKDNTTIVSSTTTEQKIVPTGNDISDGVTPITTLPTISFDPTVLPATENTVSTNGVSFRVNLSAAHTAPVTVNYTTTDGTATVGSDYSITKGTLTFEVGETAKIITVPVLNDTLVESPETFTITLSSPTNATLGTNTVATGTIQSEDVATSMPTVAFSSISATATESSTGAPQIAFTVSLSAPQTVPVSVNYKTSDDTAAAGADYSYINGSLAFAVGETSKTITVPVLDDTLVENAETFKLTLSSPTNATLGANAVATGTIVSEDVAKPNPSTLSLATTATSASETSIGTVTMTFTVNLSAAQTDPVTVKYATTNGSTLAGTDSATAGTDYEAANGILVFAPGELSKSIAVRVLDDATVENNEALTLTLSELSGNAVLGTSTGTGTILSDEVAVITPPANQAPVNTVSAAMNVVAGAPVTLSGFSVTDGNSNLTSVKLECPNSVMSVTSPASTVASSNGGATLILTGTQANINADLAKVQFISQLSAGGSQTLTMTATDASGATDVGAVAITASNATRLTSNPADAIAGTTGNDTFEEDASNANVATDVEAGDSISGAGGADTLKINAYSGSTPTANTTPIHANSTITGVETYDINVGSITPAQTYTINISSGNTDFSQLILRDGNTTLDSFIVSGFLNGDTLSLQSDANAITLGSTLGATDTATVTLADGADITALTAGSSTSDFATLTINTGTTGQHTMGTLAGGAAGFLAKDITVSGNAGLVITNALDTTQDFGTITGGAGNDGLSIAGNTAAAALSGAAGNDTLVGGDLGDTIDGGAGNDSLTAGDGDDNVVAGAGNDTIVMGLFLTDQDTIDGGSETDTLYFADNSGKSVQDLDHVTNVETIILGDVPTNVVSVEALVGSGITLTVDASALTGANYLYWDGAQETDGKFSIIGGAGNDLVTGGLGADTISTGAGHDILIGGVGADSLTGGGGDDQFIFRENADGDTIDGGADIDTLYIEQDADFQTATFSSIECITIGVTLTAAFKGTQLTGQSMVVNETSNNGNTTLAIHIGSGETTDLSGFTFAAGIWNAFDSGADIVSITGAAGNENITGTTIADKIDGLAGDDTIVGFGDADTIVGGAGADAITLKGFATGGNLSVDAGTENDTVVIADAASADWAATDTVKGGAGTDTLTLVASGALTITEATNLTEFETYKFGDVGTPASLTQTYSFTTKVADIDSSGGVTTVTFNASALTTGQLNLDLTTATPLTDNASVIGGAGVDGITGGNAADTIEGGAGADALMGGSGDDIFVVTVASDFAAGETVDGGDVIDTDILRLDAAGTYSAGQLSATVEVEQVHLNAAGTWDLTFVDGAYANVTSSAITVSSSVAQTNGITITGGATTSAHKLVVDGTNLNGGDTITGGAGTDTIDGAAGADSVDGGAEDDSITGAAGTDNLLGGAGNDVIDGGADGDTITGGAGIDNLIGGAGADVFLFGTNDADADESIDGGADTDTIKVVTNTDFSGLNTPTILTAGNVEQILITSGQTATFRGTHLTGQAINVNATDTNLATLYIIAVGGTVDFSTMNFTATGGNDAFDTGADSVKIDGTTNAEDITGTTIADQITGFAQNDILKGIAGNDIIDGSDGNDTIIGGIGADTLLGGAGDDRFIFDGGDVGAGESITDTGGTDTIVVQTTENFSNLTTATILTSGGLDQILITSGQTATFKGSQLTAQAINVNATTTSAATLAINVASGTTASFSTMTFGVTSGDEFTSGTDVVTITGATGNENITGTTIADNIDGLGGNDTLNGDAEADTITGGAGVDNLVGGAGNDLFLFDTGDVGTSESIDGGADTDTIKVVTTTDFSGLNTPTILTAGNVEQILITSGTTATFTGAQLTGQAIKVNATAAGAATLAINVASGTTASFSTMDFTAFGGNDAFDGGTDVVTITGAAGNENITGTSIADSISGLAGSDTLNGGTGNDTIDGGADGDIITGGAGLDNLTGNTGDDTFIVGAAADFAAGETITGGDGNDTLRLDDADTYNATVLSDKVSVENAVLNQDAAGWNLTFADGAYVDATNTAITLSGGVAIANDATITGGATTSTYKLVVDGTNLNGDDTITGGAGADTIDGGAGADSVNGGDNGDSITGGAGNDLVDGAAGADNIDGDDGNDAISGGAGADTLSGSAGDDEINGEDDGDSITGGAGVDTIAGAAGADNIDGGADADDISGGTEADTITGGAGADKLLGDAGNDLFIVAVVADFAAGETITGGADTDTLRLDDADTYGNTLLSATMTGVENVVLNQDAAGWNLTFADGAYVDATNTAITVSGGVAMTNGVTITGGATTNTNKLVVDGTNLNGGDTITGGAGADTIDGGAGADSVDGGAENDSITGAAGADNLLGGAGNDVIDGSADGDTITGGADMDNLIGGAGADVFLFDTGDVGASESIDGGADTDTIKVVTNTDFSGLNTPTILTAGNVEQILITSGQTATFTGAQLTGQAINVNATTTSAATLAINVASGAAADFSTMTFNATSGDEFTSGTDVVTITGAAGDENITGTSIADNIDGAAGNDMLYGDADDDTISGGLGNDDIDGGSGDDLINAGAGANAILGGAGMDTLNGGTDADLFTFNTGDVASGEVINADAGTDTIVVQTSTGFSDLATATILTAGGVEQILITSGTTATFTGAQLTAQAIKVNATAAGAATLAIGVASGTTANFSTMDFTAFGSNDAFTDGTDIVTITGAAGAENITGTSIADSISGLADNDTIDGQGGNDTIAGGDGNDALTGAAGNDTLNGDAGNDTLNGDAGNDTLNGDAGTDNLSGGDGNDALNGGNDNDTIDGGDGDDTIDTGAGDHTVAGGAGADTITAGPGADTINGGAENDTITMAVNLTAADTIDGGTGSDTLTFTDSNAAADDLANVTNVESITLGAATTVVITADGLVGNAATLEVVGSAATTLDWNGGAEADGYFDITGSAGNDTIRGGALADRIDGSAGNDTIAGNAGGDTLIGDAGNDDISGGDNNDIINGGAGNDSITGGNGNDTIIDAEGDNTIVGGAGTDTITAGTGIDTIMTAASSTDADTVQGFGATDIINTDAYTGALTKSFVSLTSATNITTNANVFVFTDTILDVASAAAVIAADATVTGTTGIIAIYDGTNTKVYSTNNLANDGTETLLLTLNGVNTSTLLDANFLV